MNNPVLEEQMRAGFINFAMIRLHLSGLSIIAILVFLLYPSQPISYFLARSVKPEMFNIALYCSLMFISYLCINSAILSIQNTKIIRIRDWFLYTKITVMTYLRGRISYGLFYTAFSFLIFMPLLLVSGSVSAIGPLNILAVFLFMYLLIVNIYFIGLFFFILFKKQHWILALIIWFIVILLFLLSPHLYPDDHPALLLMKLQRSGNLSADLKTPLITSFVSISFLIAFSWFSLFLYHRKIHE